MMHTLIGSLFFIASAALLVAAEVIPVVLHRKERK